jgi:hypothetical protein
VAIFLHVGSQILAIDSIISYAQGMNFYDGSQSISFYTLLQRFVDTCWDYPDSMAHLPGEMRYVLYFTGCHTFPLVVTSTGSTFFSVIMPYISIWFLVLLDLPIQ